LRNKGFIPVGKVVKGHFDPEVQMDYNHCYERRQVGLTYQNNVSSGEGMLFRHLITTAAAGLAIVSIMVTSSCTSAAEPLARPADFIGFITEIHQVAAKDIQGTITVESHADKLVTRYLVTIKDETLIFRQDGENYSRAALKTLETKQWIKIWFTGPIMESFPMQGTAEQVVITTTP
jgi:hypothetical protein